MTARPVPALSIRRTPKPCPLSRLRTSEALKFTYKLPFALSVIGRQTRSQIRANSETVLQCTSRRRLLSRVFGDVDRLDLRVIAKCVFTVDAAARTAGDPLATVGEPVGDR